MAYDEYRSLNSEFLCFKQDKEVFEPRDDRFDKPNFEKNVTRGVVQDIAESSGINQFNLLKHPRYAKFTYLNLLGRYFAGDFTPYTEDRDFRIEINRVWVELVTKWFFGSIWIAYGEEYRELEKAAVFRTKGNWFDPSNFPFSKLRIYVMEESQTSMEEPLPRFRSVWTNVGGLRLDPYKLVFASCNGVTNFMYCWGVLDDYLGAQEAYINYFYASLKQVYVDVQNPNKFAKELIEYQQSKNAVMILNNATTGGGDQDNDWEEFPAPEVTGCGVVMANILTYIDERLRWLGCYGKVLNQTKERTGVGEAWIDHKWVNNVRETFKMALNTMIDELKKIYSNTIPQDLRLSPTTQEPHMDDRFKHMQNWKGGDVSFGNHWNSVKGLEEDNKFKK